MNKSAISLFLGATLALAILPAHAEVVAAEFEAACRRHLQGIDCACFGKSLTTGPSQLNSRQQDYAIALLTKDETRLNKISGKFSDEQSAKSKEGLDSVILACKSQ